MVQYSIRKISLADLESLIIISKKTFSETFADDNTEELTAFKTGKGSIQLPNNKDLPINLIRRIIEFRIRKIDQLS